MTLKLKNMFKEYDGTYVLNDINLDIKDKNVISIIGNSGGGKSTLLNILSGYTKASEGSIIVNEHILKNNEKNLFEYRKNIGIVFQSYNLFPHISVLRNITLILEKVHKYSKKEAFERAAFLLEKFRLCEHRNKRPNQMSGGQQQRLAIVRALSYKPEMMFFDEPTAALDPSLTNEVLDTIKGLKDDGVHFMISTHEMGFAKNVADYVLFLNDGIIIEQGSPNDIFENPKTEELKMFLSNILEWR